MRKRVESKKTERAGVYATLTLLQGQEVWAQSSLGLEESCMQGLSTREQGQQWVSRPLESC